MTQAAANPFVELHSRWQDAFNAADMDGVLALYTEDAVLVPSPGNPVTGKEAIRAALQQFFAMKPHIDLGTDIVLQSSDVALVHAPWTMTAAGPDGNPVQMAGTAHEVFRRQTDVNWLYAIDHPFGS